MARADYLMEEDQEDDEGAMELQSLDNYEEWREILDNIEIGLFVLATVLIIISLKSREVARVYFYLEMI